MLRKLISIAGAILWGVGAPQIATATQLTIDTNWSYVDSVSVTKNSNGFASVIYKVPSNRPFILTDLIIVNPSQNLGADWSIFLGSTTACPIDSTAKTKIANLTIPPQSTLHIPFVTGIRFAAGSIICVYGNNQLSNWTINGFLYSKTPPP